MMTLIWKRYKLSFWIVLLCSLILGLFINYKNDMSISNDQSQFDEYIVLIQDQSENAKSVSIFQMYDSYDVKKIDKTAEIYNRIKDIKIDSNVMSAEENMLSDHFVYGFIILALFYELYIFVYDRDKGDDELILTLYHGKRNYYMIKLIYIIISLSVIYIISIVFILSYNIVIHHIDLYQSIQSVYGYIHCWYKVNVLSYFILINIYRFIWIGLLIVCFSILYIQVMSIYKAMIYLISIVFISILVHLFNPLMTYGVVYQLSSYYFKELYLTRIINYPVYRVNISMIILIIVSLLSLVFVLKGLDGIKESRKIVKTFKRRYKIKLHNNFYYEGKKIFIFNGFFILVLIVIVFQGIHYGLKKPVHNETIVYYRAYMEYLDGEYNLEKEEYLKAEGLKYETMKNRIQELSSNVYLTPHEQSEMNFLLNNLRGEYAYTLVNDRSEHIRLYKDASFFNDLSLYYMKESVGDYVLDFIIYLFLILLFIYLMYYEEHVHDMEIFLKTLPHNKKIYKNKIVYIMLLCLFVSVFSILSKYIYYTKMYGPLNLSYKIYSVPYLPAYNLSILQLFIIMIIITYIIYFLFAYITYTYLIKNSKI